MAVRITAAVQDLSETTKRVQFGGIKTQEFAWPSDITELYIRLYVVQRDNSINEVSLSNIIDELATLFVKAEPASLSFLIKTRDLNLSPPQTFDTEAIASIRTFDGASDHYVEATIANQSRSYIADSGVTTAFRTAGGIYEFVWKAAAKTLAIYRNGVFIGGIYSSELGWPLSTESSAIYFGAWPNTSKIFTGDFEKIIVSTSIPDWHPMSQASTPNDFWENPEMAWHDPRNLMKHIKPSEWDNYWPLSSNFQNLGANPFAGNLEVYVSESWTDENGNEFQASADEVTFVSDNYSLFAPVGLTVTLTEPDGITSIVRVIDWYTGEMADGTKYMSLEGFPHGVDIEPGDSIVITGDRADELAADIQSWFGDDVSVTVV